MKKKYSMPSILIFLLLSATASCSENKLMSNQYQPINYSIDSVVVKRKDTSHIPVPSKPGIYAIMQTSKGNLVLNLFYQDAPKTVQNFIDLAQGEKEFFSEKGKEKRPFYDGLKFHRVIEGFMAQGGCPRGDGTGGPGYKFDDEINAKSLSLDKIKIKEAPAFQSQYQRMIFEVLNIQNKEQFDANRKEIEDAYIKGQELSLLEILYRIGYRYNEKVKSHKAIKGSLAMANAGPNTNGSQFFINQVDTPHLDGLHTVFGELVDSQEVLDSIIKSGNSNTVIKKVIILDKRETSNP
jgi:cyclophilin family peptidyl-prolyl cis-trans isomerase